MRFEFNGKVTEMNVRTASFKDWISLPDEIKIVILQRLGLRVPQQNPDTTVVGVGMEVGGVATMIPSGRQRWVENVNRLLFKNLPCVDRADIQHFIETEPDPTAGKDFENYKDPYGRKLERVRAVLLGRWSKDGEVALQAELDAEDERDMEMLKQLFASIKEQE